MSIKLIIDGYNLIKSTNLVDNERSSDLESSRNFLIEKLFSYKKVRPIPATVVFDGWEGGHLRESNETRKGIRVIFSRRGEEADNVIERITREGEGGFIVVTSDRLLAASVRQNGASVISSSDFAAKLKMAQYGEMKGFQGEDEVDQFSRGKTKKKGNPRRISKKLRREKGRLDKL